RILAATPSNGQRLLFSATLDNGVDKLVKRFLRNHVMHSVDEANSPVAEMTYHVFHVGSAGAKAELVHRLASGTGRRILFMRTKHQARKLARQLTDAGVPSVDLHGSGRTARAGSAGDVVTVVLPEQRRDTSALMRRAGISVAPQQVTAASEPVTELVGEIAPYQAPAPKTTHVQHAPRSQP